MFPDLEGSFEFKGNSLCNVWKSFTLAPWRLSGFGWLFRPEKIHSDIRARSSQTRSFPPREGNELL